MSDIVRGSAILGSPRAAWNVSNQFSIVVLIRSHSVIFCGRLSKNPDNATGSSFVESEPSVISPHFLLVLSRHFSTPRVYRILIIECYAQLPLRAPYVALSVFLSISLPLLPERALCCGELHNTNLFWRVAATL